MKLQTLHDSDALGEVSFFGAFAWLALVGGLAILMLTAAMPSAEAATETSQSTSLVPRVGEMTTLHPIGSHVPLFILEKSENPQNVMVVYAKLDDDCRFETKNGVPVMSQYWLMDRERYKPVHRLIQNGIRNRIQIVSDSREPVQHALSSTHFQVRLTEFNELNHDLGRDPLIDVQSGGRKGKCSAEVSMSLGPSDHNRRIDVSAVYAESQKTWRPPFRELKALSVRGYDAMTHEQLERTYSAK